MHFYSMTLEEFFDLYPVSRVGIARMLGMPVKRLYNIHHRNSLASSEEIQLLNEAIHELSSQLGRVHVHNKLIYEAKCRFCDSDFKAVDDDTNTLFYAMNGLVCDKCRIDPKYFDLIEAPTPTTQQGMMGA